MKSEGTGVRSVEDLRNRLNESHPFTLAFVFSSVVHPISQIQKLFAERNVTLAGITSAGEICETGGSRNTWEEGISVLLVNLSTDNFNQTILAGTDKTSLELGIEAGRWGKTQFANPIFLIFSAGLSTDGEALVKGIQQVAGIGVPVYGGLAGDDLRMVSTHVYTAETETSNGLQILVFNGDQVEVSGLAASGWMGVGSEKTVTRSAGNIVYEIDGQPALSVYKRYIADLTGREMITMAAEYPLQIIKPEGYSVLRAAMVVNEEDGSLIFAGTVPEGSKVKFSSPAGFEIRDIAVRDLSVLKSEVENPDAVLLISCKARHLALGPMVEDEIRDFYQFWRKPVVGFFSYGEIGVNRQGFCDFHNETCILLTIREK